MDRSFADPRRLLELGDYLGLLLFGLLNPVARTLRGLCHASRFKKVQRDVCGRPASLGSLSEAQHLVNVEVLERVMNGLVRRHLAERRGTVAAKSVADQAGELVAWMAHDGSSFPALDRMSWALYGGGPGGGSKAVKLHLSFYVDVDVAARASVCEASACERGELREKLQPGAAYVGDRLYGMEHAFFEHLNQAGCRYCIRIKDDTEIGVIEELPLGGQDRLAGVLRQRRVRLGLGKRTAQSPELRLVEVRGITGEILLLVTNLGPEQLSAAEVALLYKKRWQIEYFFRWIKCVMGCGHWMAESRNGATIQLYLALIASLLLQLQLGRRPSKRIWETLQWHQCGMIGHDELQASLVAELAREQRRRNPRPRAPFWKKT